MAKKSPPEPKRRHNWFSTFLLLQIYFLRPAASYLLVSFAAPIWHSSKIWTGKFLNNAEIFFQSERINLFILSDWKKLSLSLNHLPVHIWLKCQIGALNEANNKEYNYNWSQEALRAPTAAPACSTVSFTVATEIFTSSWVFDDEVKTRGAGRGMPFTQDICAQKLKYPAK